jgi:hypothetical protein
METLFMDNFIRLKAVRQQIGDRDSAGKAVSYPYCGHQIKPEEREVGEVILGKGFFVQVGVNKPESPQCLPAQRIIFEFGNKNSLCVSDNHMSDAAGSIDKDAYLPVEFMRQFREIAGELGAHDFARDFPSVNSLEGLNVAGFKPRQITVKCWYVYPPTRFMLYFIIEEAWIVFCEYCGPDS